MKPTLVAVTRPRPRLDRDSGTWWKEYRVRNLSPADWDEARRTGRAGPWAEMPPRGGFLVEHRRVDADGGVETPEDWKGWWTAATFAEVIDDMLGDTDFLKAESRHPTHAVLVRHHHERVAANNAEYDTGEAVKAAALAAALADKAADAFAEKKGAEYAAGKEGLTPAAAETLRKRIVRYAKPKLAALRAEARLAAETWEAAKTAHAAAAAAAKKVKARTPKLADYPDLAARFAPAAVAA